MFSLVFQRPGLLRVSRLFIKLLLDSCKWNFLKILAFYFSCIRTFDHRKENVFLLWFGDEFKWYPGHYQQDLKANWVQTDLNKMHRRKNLWTSLPIKKYCLCSNKISANPLLLLQESFDHLNSSFPEIIPSEMPLQRLISSFTSFQFSYLLPISSPSVLQNGFSFNMYQQLFVCLWKVPTALLNSVPFSTLLPALPVSGTECCRNSRFYHDALSATKPRCKDCFTADCVVSELNPWPKSLYTHNPSFSVTSQTVARGTDNVGAYILFSFLQRKAEWIKSPFAEIE